jgi:hypothetical protein
VRAGLCLFLALAWSWLLWQASAPEMNPTLPADYLDRMRTDYPEAYRSEVLGEFRAGLTTLLDPDVSELLRELRGLERHRGPSGRDRVDHRPGQHDDLANAAAGALVLAAAVGTAVPVEYGERGGIPEEEIAGNWLDMDDKIREFLAGW